jgi:hypothetical protein
MQHPTIMRAHAETEDVNGYEVRQSSDLAALYASLVQEDGDWQEQRSLWDRVLGLGTIVLVSICGWAVIIEVVRLLR